MTNDSTTKIAFIEAMWHREIVEQSRCAFTAAWQEMGQPKQDIHLYAVPGSLEIPLLAKRLAEGRQYAAIVAAGLVVDGGIYRHDFVASAVLNGLMTVQLDSLVPILSVVLTPHQFNDGAEHRQFFKDHFLIKGKEAAEACAKIVDIYRRPPFEVSPTAA